MPTGVVKWFNSEKGYGFISQDDGGPDVFLHFTNIKTNGYRSVEENQHVEFDVTQGPKGPQAENVTVIAGQAGAQE
ncbi:Cold shock protein ScoF [Cladobotryum mycophilum]|uniref:Cold shock protein ScoF n=1 Tax=Cladobotryum mycophilum TaxID=491253 RepID=A0ABR0SXB7_9HYPO